MTGMSSRMGYTRLHSTHFRPFWSCCSSTGALHSGQTRISSRSLLMAIENVSVTGPRPGPPTKPPAALGALLRCLGDRQLPHDHVLAHLIDHQFMGLALAPDVELHWFVRSLVLLLELAVVRLEFQRIGVGLGVGLLQQNRNIAQLDRILALV